MNAWQKFKASGEADRALEKAEEVIKENTRALGTMWRVMYRRAEWQEQTPTAVRYYRYPAWAWKFIEEKLLGGDRPELSGVEYTLERIWTLGDWEVVSGK